MWVWGMTGAWSEGGGAGGVTASMWACCVSIIHFISRELENRELATSSTGGNVSVLVQGYKQIYKQIYIYDIYVCPYCRVLMMVRQKPQGFG